MDSCAGTSVSTDFFIFYKNLIPSRSALPCSALHIVSETRNYCRSPSVRTMIGRQKAQPQRTSATALLSILKASASRSTILPSKSATPFHFRCIGRLDEASLGAGIPSGLPPLTPRRAQPPEHPSAPHWFGSVRRAAIPPFHTVGVPSSFPTRRASAARQQGPMSRFP